jgi:hypothetical protein
MDEIARDLFCSVIVTGNTRSYSYLIKRNAGNVLVHGLGPKAHKMVRGALAQLGGVQHQVMCHWHEAKHFDPAFYQEHAPEVHVPELERDFIHGLLGGVVKVSAVRDRQRLLGDLVPYRVSGHSADFTVYQWRDFVFGGDFMVRRGDKWMSVFERAHVQAGLRGLDTLRGLRATQWLPLKSSGTAPVPFAFDASVIASVEQKLRKKWKLPAAEL